MLDIYQDKRFSIPQFIYDKKQKIVGQVSVDDNGVFHVRRATLKHNDWGEWVAVKNVPHI